MGNNHLQWFDSSKRKVLVLSFEEDYLKQISKSRLLQRKTVVSIQP